MRRLRADPVQSKLRMLAFDRLPQSIRDIMNDSFCDFPPVDVLNYFVMNGEARTVANLKASEVRARQVRIREVGF